MAVVTIVARVTCKVGSITEHIHIFLYLSRKLRLLINPSAGLISFIFLYMSPAEPSGA